MAGSQISTSVTIIDSLLGFQAVSLTNMTIDDESAPAIAAGSKVEVAGAFFTFGSDDDPQASTWTSISTGESVYITVTPSGTAGSQILTSKFSTSDPVWSDSKQGWYSSSGSNIRYVAGCFKGSNGVYADKFIVPDNQIYNHPKTLLTATKITGLSGSALAVSVTEPDIVALDSTTIALVDIDADTLRTYTWSGSAWTLTGSALSILGSTESVIETRIAKLTASTVAVLTDSTNEHYMRTCAWSGSVWTTVGTPFNAGGGSFTGGTRLSDTTIVVSHSGSIGTCTFTWDGSTWSATGNGLLDRTRCFQC